ncbi:DUF4153 domain-containing protein [Micromonospora sp. NPDC000089]|uniref:DUF4153 domain-containing protein n=1 Tax=unclassified Micromonospora TaxID=2617518 RepID=UPI0036B17B6B
MPESPAAPDSPTPAPAGGSAERPADPPQLLVMPASTDALPGVPWPGPDDRPAWAIPVSVPPGTRGYALFIPLVPVDEDGRPAPGAVPTVPAPSVGPPPVAAPPAPAPPVPAPADAARSVAAPADAARSATVPADAARSATVPADAARSATVPADATPVDASGSGPAPAGQALTDTTQAEATPPASREAGAAVPPSPAPQQRQGSQPGPPAAPSGPTAAQPGPPAAPSGPTAAAPGAPASQPAAAQPGAPTPQLALAQPGTPAPPQPGAQWPHPGPYPQQPGRPWTGAPAHPGAWAPIPRQPRTSFLGARWPGPKPATGRAVPAAVLAGALGIAAFVPLTRTGIGWFLGWLVLTGAVLVGVRRHTAGLARGERLVRGGWAVAALALLAVLGFRNAWWLVTFCVLGALGCATLAIVGGRLVRSILFSLVAAPFAALRGLPWVRRHLRAPADADTGTARRVALSVVATVLVLLVFGSLLSSADAAFSELIGALVPEVSVGATFRRLFLAVVGALIAVAAVYTLAAPPELSTVDRPARRSLGLVEWAPAIGALTLLFAGFVAVQFTVLFGGDRHVLATAGLSYAEYARSGFWQLLFVTLLTVAVLGLVSRWARRESAAERMLLRALLGLLSALGVVIVVSALSRMYAYQKVYSFTGERIFVMAFELLLGVVFLMILAAGARWRGRWIPSLTVALAVAMLLGLAVLNPEDYAARRNVARYEQTGKIDAWYLRALSADATPALTTLPDPVRRCTLSWIADDLAEDDPWYAWNLGRHRARQALDKLGKGAVGGPGDCREADQYDLPKTPPR